MDGYMKLYAENNNYKLYEGNMLNMLEIIESDSIDSIITDPPYELNFMNKGWDNMGISFQKETWQKCLAVLKSGGYLLAFGGSRTHHRIACAIEDAGFEIRDTIMWLVGSGFPKSMNIGLAMDKKNGVKTEIAGYAEGTVPDFRDTGKKQKIISGIDKLTFGQIENSKRKKLPIYDVQNEWKGWGTCLKPSYEAIIVARKPFKGAVIDNVLKHGVGGLNIDECRISATDQKLLEKNWTERKSPAGFHGDISGIYGKGKTSDVARYKSSGRFPANTILTYDNEDFEEVCGGLPNTKSQTRKITNKGSIGGNGIYYGVINNDIRMAGYEDSGSAARYFKNCQYSQKDIEPKRYFYCGKASKRDRDEGLENFENIILDIGDERPSGGSWERRTGRKPYPRKNSHPTVKPTSLMQYLVRLVTPNGGTVLDPFNGSGSTGKAVMYENNERNKNYKYIGIETNEEYLEISKARIEYAKSRKSDKNAT